MVVSETSSTLVDLLNELTRLTQGTTEDSAEVTELRAIIARRTGGIGPSRVVSSMLNAVASGRAELVCSCEPDLIVDGLCCCDQYTAHRLSEVGLIRPAMSGRIGDRVPAELTESGFRALRGAA